MGVSGLELWGLGFRASGLRGSQGLGFGVWGLGCKVSGLRVWGLGFRVWGFGFRSLRFKA